MKGNSDPVPSLAFASPSNVAVVCSELLIRTQDKRHVGLNRATVCLRSTGWGGIAWTAGCPSFQQSESVRFSDDKTQGNPKETWPLSQRPALSQANAHLDFLNHSRTREIGAGPAGAGLSAWFIASPPHARAAHSDAGAQPGRASKDLHHASAQLQAPLSHSASSNQHHTMFEPTKLSPRHQFLACLRCTYIIHYNP
jgi:hypothetical protein